MKNVLEVRNLGKSYSDFQLEDLSFSLPAGHIMGLIGPNGSGKTTLLKMVMNMIVKDQGEISVFGMDPALDEVAVKRKVAFVSDQPDHYCELSLKALKDVVSPFYEDWDEARFQYLTRKFDLPLHKQIKKLSKGMQVQASITLALSRRPALLLMDEPTAGLDPIIRRELLVHLREAMEDESLSILFSTHITTDIEQVADYVTCILNGHVLFSDTKDDILQHHALIKGGKELLDRDTKSLFVGIRENEFGFEALTDRREEVKQLFGDQVVVDRASLEDILYYHKLRTNKNLSV